MQINYHSVLTKIQKLQNLKKKKKFCTGRYTQYCPKLAGTRPVRPVFFPVRNKGAERTGLLVGMVYSGRTDRYGTESITLILGDVQTCAMSFLNFLICDPIYTKAMVHLR